MKYFTIISTLLFTLASSGWAMSNLPNGSWAGTGKYTTSAGKTGVYTVTLNVQNNEVKKVAVADGKTFTMDAKVTLDTNGFGSSAVTFTAPNGKVYSATVGASCGDDVCSYWSESAHFGTTVAFHGNDVYDFGGRTKKDKSQVRWQETLHKVSTLE